MKMTDKHNIKIYGTLGPSCSTAEILTEMFLAGMTGVRLNLSHTTLKEAAPLLKEYFTAAQKADIAPDLLVDMQGPELRIGKLKAPLQLKEGDTLLLGPEKENSEPIQSRIPVSALILSELLPGREVLLDDGKLLLRILSKEKECSTAEVLRGGVLQSSKSIAISGSSLTPPAMTAQDLENIRDAAAFGVTGVMQPFVRSAEDLKEVRQALDRAGCGHIRLFAKIENLSGVNNLESFFPLADEIVIARGDLGNAMPLWELPKYQKQIEAACKKAGKPFMVVTQMLASMEGSPVPTRAEVSDIYNAAADGAASVMVTGETAVGRYPVEVIRYLANTANSYDPSSAAN